MQLLNLALSLLVASASAAAVPAQKADTVKVDITPAMLQRLEDMFAHPEIVPGQAPKEISAFASSATRTDLVDGKCNDIIIIFARGTGSPGNMGDGEGPAFVDAVEALRPGKTIVQGVEPYPATVGGYLAGGSDEGAQSMADLTARAASQCPGSSIVWGGYSQGAQVTHKAAKKTATSLYNRIKAIVLIGDPNEGDALPSGLQGKQKTWCHDDDPICDGIPLPIGGHLNYEQDAPAMAEFVVGRL